MTQRATAAVNEPWILLEGGSAVPLVGRLAPPRGSGTCRGYCCLDHPMKTVQPRHGQLAKGTALPRHAQIVKGKAQPSHVQLPGGTAQPSRGQVGEETAKQRPDHYHRRVRHHQEAQHQ